MGRSGGGGGFGGGRSGGFSGGFRRSGGFSGGAGRGRSGRSGGFGSFGGGFGGRPAGPPPGRAYSGGGSSFWPFLAGMSLGRATSSRRPAPMGGPAGPVAPGAGGAGCMGGCGTILGFIVALALIFALISTFASCGSGAAGSGGTADVPSSTVEREALPADSAHITGWFTDADGGWIRDSSKLERGLKEFHDKTGVAPYVYILPNGTTTSVSALSSEAERLYEELFDDEAHFLLVFCDDGAGSFNAGYAMGTQVGAIMDDEAINILSSYLDRWYSDYSISEEEIFSNAFADTGERIMSVTVSPVVPIAIVGGVVVVAALVFVGVKRYRQSKEREAEKLKEALETPLETFGDQDLDDLEEKYRPSAGAGDGDDSKID